MCVLMNVCVREGSKSKDRICVIAAAAAAAATAAGAPAAEVDERCWGGGSS